MHCVCCTNDGWFVITCFGLGFEFLLWVLMCLLWLCCLCWCMSALFFVFDFAFSLVCLWVFLVGCLVLDFWLLELLVSLGWCLFVCCGCLCLADGLLVWLVLVSLCGRVWVV